MDQIGIQVSSADVLARLEHLQRQIEPLLEDRRNLNTMMQGIQQQLAHIPALAEAVMHLHEKYPAITNQLNHLSSDLTALAQMVVPKQGFGSPAPYPPAPQARVPQYPTVQHRQVPQQQYEEQYTPPPMRHSPERPNENPDGSPTIRDQARMLSQQAERVAAQERALWEQQNPGMEPPIPQGFSAEMEDAARQATLQRLKRMNGQTWGG